MSLDTIETEFGEKAIRRGGLMFFSPKDAIRVIQRCRILHRRILGIDAFILTDTITQPVMAESVEYDNNTVDTWERAMEFLNERLDSEFCFEVVYE